MRMNAYLGALRPTVCVRFLGVTLIECAAWCGSWETELRSSERASSDLLAEPVRSPFPGR